MFSFEKLTEEDVRIENKNFDIEILSTDTKGNTMFMVYGYMAKGAHEGQVGVALYQYDYKENQVTELIFVPSDRPFDIFRDSVRLYDGRKSFVFYGRKQYLHSDHGQQ